MKGILLESLWPMKADKASKNPVMVAIIQAQLDTTINQYKCETISVDIFSTSKPQDLFFLRCLAHVLQLVMK